MINWKLSGDVFIVWQLVTPYLPTHSTDVGGRLPISDSPKSVVQIGLCIYRMPLYKRNLPIFGKKMTTMSFRRPGSDWPGGLPGDSRWAGGPVGRWAGGQQNYYDTIFCCPLILSIRHNKNRIVYQELVMAKRLVTEKLNCDSLFHFISNVTFGHYNSW